MNVRAHSDTELARRPSREEVADLLVRYPRVSDAEAKLILAFLRKGRHLDVGMVTGDERLKPYIDRFTADHASHFRLSIYEGTALVAAMLGFLTVCWLVWEVARSAA
jgi:hypothetical protein